MPGTAINAIDYSNEDTALAIEEVLNETSQQQPQQQQQQPPQQQQYQPPPQQYQQPPPQSMPNQMPSQYPQEYPQGHPQQPPQYFYDNDRRENFEQQQSMVPSMSGFTFPDSLKKTLMLFAILLLLNNSSFKNVLAKIPLTTNIDGEHTFMMTLIVCVIIAVVYFLASQVF